MVKDKKTKAKKGGKSNGQPKLKPGQKLNKMDRAKVAKLAQKRELKDMLKQKVDEELETLGVKRPKKDVDEASESSFGSVPPPKQKKKRVSFAEALEHQKIFDKDTHVVDAKPSSASPGRSIIAKKNAAKAAKLSKPKIELEFDDDEDIVEPQEAESNGDADPQFPSVGDGKTKKTIKVTKNIKEELLKLPRKDRKKFLVEIKSQRKPAFALAKQCKQIWEKLRMKRCPEEQKIAMISELVGIIKGHCKELVYAHDMSRVIQFLIALKREGITKLLFDELATDLVKMSKGLYSKRVVTLFLKLGGSEIRRVIKESFRGHRVSMMLNVWSATVLEKIYTTFSNNEDRFDIVSEFYGQEFVVFRNDQCRNLRQLIENDPPKKSIMLSNLESVLLKIVEKVTLRHTLTHRLLIEFFDNCDKDQREMMIDSLKDKLPEIVHTNCGMRTAIKCIIYGTPEQRKMIVRSFHDLSVKAANDLHGFKVLCAIFDHCDETNTICKHIVAELANNVAAVMKTNFGTYALKYLCHPRDPRCVDVGMVRLLSEGDGNTHSKLKPENRYSPLFKKLCPGLLTYCAANMREVLLGEQSKYTSVVLLNALELQKKDDLFTREVDPELRIQCYDAIRDLAKEEFIPMDPNGLHIIEHLDARFVLARLVLEDPHLPAEQQLSTKLSQVGNEQLGTWIFCKSGCFLLLKMLENGNEKTQKKVKAAVDKKRLATYTHEGASLLLKALTGEDTKNLYKHLIVERKQIRKYGQPAGENPNTMEVGERKPIGQENTAPAVAAN